MNNDTLTTLQQTPDLVQKLVPEAPEAEDETTSSENNPGGIAGSGEKNEELRPPRYSDDALAQQFSAEYVDELRYVTTWGWLEWTGKRWNPIPDVRVMQRVRPICRRNAEMCR